MSRKPITCNGICPGCRKVVRFNTSEWREEPTVRCPHCKTTVHYEDDILLESGLDLAEWRSFPFSEGKGCFDCGGTGFRGRTAIHELLDLTERIREMILDKRPTSEIKRVAREDGMTFLRESAVDKVRRGETTLREINKVTFIEG